jgi:hypothetical protein
MKLGNTLLGYVLGLCFASQAFADAPSYVSIPPVVNGQANPSYGGSGCPAGSARAIVAPDLKSFTIIFDKYIVNATGSNAMDRKNCQILVNLDFPQGWTYSIARMDYRGFYNISAGATGSQQALYYFQGSLVQGRLNTIFNGPTSGDYTISDTLQINNLVWAPCGSRSGLNVNSSLMARVGPNNPAGFAQLTTDSADGRVQTTYSLQWQRCSRN